MLFSCYQTLGKLMRLLQGKKKKCISNPGIQYFSNWTIFGSSELSEFLV